MKKMKKTKNKKNEKLIILSESQKNLISNKIKKNPRKFYIDRTLVV